MKPGKVLDRFVALALGLVEGKDFGSLGQHNWERNEYSEHNQYLCSKCRASSDDWAEPDKLPLDGCYKEPPNYSTWVGCTISLIEQFRLVIRPSLLSDKWVAGRLSRVLLDGKIAIEDEVTGETLPHTVCLAIVKASEKK